MSDRQPAAVPTAPSNPLTALPKLSLYLAGTLLIGFIISCIAPIGSLVYLALVPGFTFRNFFIWNVFTAGFLETGFFSLLFNGLIILFVGKTMEPIVGSKEWLRFTLLTNLWTGILSAVTMGLAFSMGGSEQKTLYSIMSGANGLVTAYLVCIKQLMPENQLNFLFIFSFKAKHVPMVFTIMGTVMALLVGKPEQLCFQWYGLFVAWMYLRFFQKKADGSIGDASDAFSFVTFFPTMTHGVLSKVFNAIFSCFGKVPFVGTVLRRPGNSGPSLPVYNSGIGLRPLGGGANSSSSSAVSPPSSSAHSFGSGAGHVLGDSVSSPPSNGVPAAQSQAASRIGNALGNMFGGNSNNRYAALGTGIDEDEEEDAFQEHSAAVAMPSSEMSDIEKRRQLALKASEKRFANASAPPMGPGSSSGHAGL